MEIFRKLINLSFLKCTLNKSCSSFKYSIALYPQRLIHRGYKIFNLVSNNRVKNNTQSFTLWTTDWGFGFRIFNLNAVIRCTSWLNEYLSFRKQLIFLCRNLCRQKSMHTIHTNTLITFLPKKIHHFFVHSTVVEPAETFIL